ncbi:TMV resistance protein N-like [Bidens hawaiensis]|uniref:TMV resistance protein N-like n=1 Tax=Bidens hawaiensis TaxID=980011 RepID=UPI00404A62D6
MHGLKTFQKKIMSDVFKTKVTLRDTNQGMSMMTTRLSQNSVLIVLDDVDNVFHLDMLAASREWLGDDDEEAIELFSLNAFGASRPEEGYEELAQSIVSKLSGHPATLKNLGSFLHGKDKLEWTSALATLEGIPVDEILEKVNPGDDRVTRNTFSWLLTRGDEIIVHGYL